MFTEILLLTYWQFCRCVCGYACPWTIIASSEIYCNRPSAVNLMTNWRKKQSLTIHVWDGSWRVVNTLRRCVNINYRRSQHSRFTFWINVVFFCFLSVFLDIARYLIVEISGGNIIRAYTSYTQPPSASAFLFLHISLLFILPSKRNK